MSHDKINYGVWSPGAAGIRRLFIWGLPYFRSGWLPASGLTAEIIRGGNT
jgi:hypothetical protein